MLESSEPSAVGAAPTPASAAAQAISETKVFVRMVDYEREEEEEEGETTWKKMDTDNLSPIPPFMRLSPSWLPVLAAGRIHK